MLVSNIGKAITKKKLAVKFEGNEVLSIDDFGIFACYRSRLVEDKIRKRNAIRQGIISDDVGMENCIKLRINTAEKTLETNKIKLLPKHTGTNSSFLLNLKC